MTVTTPPSDLATAAARYSALGLHSYAAQLYADANSNATRAAAIQAASAPAISPPLVGYNTSALVAARLAWLVLSTNETRTSHVQQTSGHDGSTLTG